MVVPLSGLFWLLHVLPPSMFRRIVPLPPTVKQVLGLEQATPDRSLVIEEVAVGDIVWDGHGVPTARPPVVREGQGWLNREVR
jgi:hypothetical protein